MATLPRSHSVQPFVASTQLPGWRPRRIQRRDFYRQAHGNAPRQCVDVVLAATVASYLMPRLERTLDLPAGALPWHVCKAPLDTIVAEAGISALIANRRADSEIRPVQ